MKTRPVVLDSETCRAADSSQPLGRAWKCPSIPHGRAMRCYAKGRSLGGLIFRVLRESAGAIVMITDPETVRETLGLLEAEPGIGHTTHK